MFFKEDFILCWYEKNFVWCVVLSAVLAACDRKKAVSEVDYADDSVIDSLFDSPDSLIFSSGSSDEELPKRADELFDDLFLSLPVLKKSSSNVSNFHCFRLYGEIRRGSRRSSGNTNRFS